jgi:hypothetical protein
MFLSRVNIVVIKRLKGLKTFQSELFIIAYS